MKTKKTILSILVLFAILTSYALLFSSCGVPKTFTKSSFEYFDTVTNITVYAKSKADFEETSERIMTELAEYHKLYDIYNEYEGMNNLCSVNRRGSSSPITTNSKIIDLLSFSKDIYTLTNGKTNIALGSILKPWHDARVKAKSDPSYASLPSMTELQAASAHTDISKLIIDRENSTVFLSDPQMSLDVGAVAKGYAVECIANSLDQGKFIGVILNVGGNVRTLGKKPDGKAINVGIEDPNGNEDKPYYAVLALEDRSLVTSGSYQKFFTVDGVDYHHIIDPKTLMPSRLFISVSVVCRSSAVADGLSTALFCTELEEGRRLIEGLDDTEAIWVTLSGEKVYSSGFHNIVKGLQ